MANFGSNIFVGTGSYDAAAKPMKISSNVQFRRDEFCLRHIVDTSARLVVLARLRGRVPGYDHYVDRMTIV